MDDLSRLLKLAERHRDERSRIKGRIDGIKKNLRSKGFKGEVHARRELKSLKGKARRMRTDFDKRVTTFRKKYAKQLAETN